MASGYELPASSQSDDCRLADAGFEYRVYVLLLDKVAVQTSLAFAVNFNLIQSR
jgi:hypothetical protein